MIEKLNSVLPRLFFIAAILLFVIAVWGRVLELFGWRYAYWDYSSGRLLEFAAIMLIFVITMLLRQIRDKK